MNNVLLVAKTGQLRDGLLALLAALPGVGPVSITDNLKPALEYLSERCPTLVLLVPDAYNQDVPSINEMKELCPKTHILALVTNEKDDQTIAAWNVDATLPIGVTPLELSAAIEALLPGNC